MKTHSSKSNTAEYSKRFMCLLQNCKTEILYIICKIKKLKSGIMNKKTKEQDISDTDIMICIPTFNEVDNIDFVTKEISKGLEEFYPDYNPLIVDCDNGSTDNTKDMFLQVKTNVEKKVLETKEGEIGKGYALKMFFKLAQKSKIKAAATFDADLKSITPGWIKLQIQPILDGHDYTTPLYSRFKYDATITNHICYPLIYGLFCCNIRQPVGGDFAFSAQLIDYWLEKSFWTINAPLFGIDIFMTANAILGDFNICQVNLKSKIHNVKDPAKTLSPMFRQVISTFFKIIIDNPEKLKKFDKVKDIPVIGGKSLGKPQKFSIDIEATKSRFVRGFIRRRHIIKKCLSKEDYTKLRNMVHYDKIHIPSVWWAKIVYDYILAFKKHEKDSSTILKSFIPLWFGRIYTFINETIDMSTRKAEFLIEKQAEEFFKQRNYLLDRL